LQYARRRPDYIPLAVRTHPNPAALRAGEPGVPPIPPPVVNAVYAATKKRICMRPFARNSLTAT